MFARRQNLGKDLIGFAHTIYIRALAKLGEVLRQLPKATGGKRLKGSTGARGRISRTEVERLIVKAPTAEELQITRKTRSIAQQLAELPEATREAIAQREKTLSEVRRERKAQDIRTARFL